MQVKIKQAARDEEDKRGEHSLENASRGAAEVEVLSSTLVTGNRTTRKLNAPGEVLIGH